MTALAAPRPVDTRALLELVGFALCHGIWTVSDGSPLPPAVLVDGPEGRMVARMPADSQGDALLLARGNVESLRDGLARSAVVYDGYVRDGGDPVDAVVVEGRIGGHPEVITVVLRYRAADDPAGFAILGRPMFGGPVPAEIRRRAEGFLDRGIGQHPAAAELWSQSWRPDGVDLRRTA